jgi:hypothetical protein
MNTKTNKKEPILLIVQIEQPHLIVGMFTKPKDALKHCPKDCEIFKAVSSGPSSDAHQSKG